MIKFPSGQSKTASNPIKRLLIDVRSVRVNGRRVFIFDFQFKIEEEQ